MASESSTLFLFFFQSDLYIYCFYFLQRGLDNCPGPLQSDGPRKLSKWPNRRSILKKALSEPEFRRVSIETKFTQQVVRVIKVVKGDSFRMFCFEL